ncbi:MAG: RDD family protein [Streptosporangiaceae bacterium]
MAEVVTGEAVILDLPVAQAPVRILGLLIDLAVQVPVLVFGYVVVFSAAARHLNAASASALAVAMFVLVAVGYPVAFETLSRGKSLGKLAVGIRIVSDDGGAIRFRQALVRALAAAFIEIWLLPLLPVVVFGLPAGLITSLVSERHKRLGDMFAGTFAITERLPRRPDLPPVFAAIPPPLAGWAAHLEVSRLPDASAVAAGSYLRRYFTLRPVARQQLGARLATEIAAQISPPPPAGTPPEALLAAVLAVRREREQARLRPLRPLRPDPARSWPAPGTAPAPAPPWPGTAPAVPPATSPAAAPVAAPPAEPAAEPAAAGGGPAATAPPDDFGFATPF